MSRPVSVLLVLAAACIVATIALSRTRPPGSAPSAAVDSGGSGGSARSVPAVRVLITHGGSGEPMLAVDGPYRVFRPGDWRVLAQGNELAEAPVSAAGEGLTIGTQSFATEALRIEVIEPASLWVDGRRYRGELWIHRRDASRVRLVNHLALEDYVASVVACEMPASFPHEAQVAQAVAARTFALYQMKTRGAQSEYDLADDQRSQVYRGVVGRRADGSLWEVECEESRAATRASAGVALTYERRVFCSYYSAVCGGETLPGRTVFDDAAPPLVNVPCAFCADAPHHRWEITRPASDVFRQVSDMFDQQGRSIGVVTALAPDDAASASSEFRAQGDQASDTLTAAELRRAVGTEHLPSARFEVIASGPNLVFRGRGFGHGVGLCQWGARGQALAGRSAAQILAHYYPAAVLMRVE